MRVIGSAFDFKQLRSAILPKRLFCEECEGYISSTMPWICAYCGAKHEFARLYSFLYKCKHCKRRPSGVECPRCNTVWLFEQNGNAKGVAKQLPPKVPEAPVLKTETAAEKRKREHDERMADLRFTQEEAEVLAKIRDAEEKQGPKLPKQFQKLADDLLSGQAAVFGFTVLASALRKHWDVVHKDNADLREKLNMWLDEKERDNTHSF